MVDVVQAVGNDSYKGRALVCHQWSPFLVDALEHGHKESLKYFRILEANTGYSSRGNLTITIEDGD
jgi:hypothetical protein